MKLPRRTFLHLAAGAAALPAVSRFAGANLSDAAGAHHRRRPRRHVRHRRTPDRANGCLNGSASRSSSRTGLVPPAIIATEAVVRAPATATRSSSSPPRTRSMRRSTTSSITISSATSRPSRASSASPTSWWSIHQFQPKRFPSSSPMPRPIRQAQLWRRPGSAPGPIGRRVVQGGDRRQHGSRALSRCSARADRPAWRTSPGRVLRAACRRSSTSERQAAPAGSDRRDALGGAARPSDRWRFRAGYEVSSWFGLGVPKNTPCEIVDRLNNEINAALADPKIEARLADLGATVLPGSPADFGKLDRRRNREVGQGDPVREHQAGVTHAAPFRNSDPRTATTDRW